MNHQKQQLSGQRQKTKLKKDAEQIKEQNVALTETETPNTGPRAKAVTQTSDVFVKQVVFLTVNHRGPLPLREL